MEKEITMEELVKMVNESSGEIIIHVELGEERDSDDIVNIGLHFFHKDVRPMQLPVKKYSTVVA